MALGTTLTSEISDEKEECLSILIKFYIMRNKMLEPEEIVNFLFAWIELESLNDVLQVPLVKVEFSALKNHGM